MWIAFRRFCDSSPRRRRFSQLGRNLVLEHRVSGVQVHDTRIVAAMSIHQVSKILSFDLDDFTRYSGITVVHPAEVK
jgi:hypothetical protein